MLAGAVLLFASAAGSAAQEAELSAEAREILVEVEGEIQAAMEEHGIPGVSLVLVNEDDILWYRGLGVLDEDSGREVTDASPFSIQSATKTLTALAVMLAAQDGLVDLDAPLTDYLPGYSVQSRFEARPEEKMTLRHLLSHTAGFTHEAPVGSNFDASSCAFDEHVASISDTWLRYPVGERYQYSNLGIDVAGYVLEVVSGMPFHEYVAEHLFRPLGMDASFIDTPDHHAGNCEDCASGHDPDYARLPDCIPLAPSGGARLSARDGARLLRFLLNHGRHEGESLLQGTWLDEVYRPHAAIPMPYSGLDQDQAYYGLGVYAFPEGDTYALNHDGGGFGFRASMKWYPEHGLGYLLMMNSRGGEEHVWEAVWSLLEELLESDVNDAPRRPLAMDPEEFFRDPVLVHDREGVGRDPQPQPVHAMVRWQEYIGEYRPEFRGELDRADSADMPWWDVSIFEDDGILYVEADGREPEPLHQHEPGLLFGGRSGEALDFRGDVPTWRNIRLVER